MNTTPDSKQKQKKSPIGPILVAILAFFFLMPDSISDAALGIIAVVILIVIIAGVLIAVGKTRKKTAPGHTHDRIDHSSDLKINKKTGKVVSRPVNVPVHSPREHWKQQLDGLLANGTIDRAEYNAMMNRKF